MFEVTYQEVNKRDEVVTKRKSFKTAAARDKFVEGKITWYVSEDYPPADALTSIRACAEQERVKYETWLNGLSPAARREYELEHLPLPEFLEELRKAREAKEEA